MSICPYCIILESLYNAWRFTPRTPVRHVWHSHSFLRLDGIDNSLNFNFTHCGFDHLTKSYTYINIQGLLNVLLRFTPETFNLCDNLYFAYIPGSRSSVIPRWISKCLHSPHYIISFYYEQERHLFSDYRAAEAQLYTRSFHQRQTFSKSVTHKNAAVKKNVAIFLTFFNKIHVI